MAQSTTDYALSARCNASPLTNMTRSALVLPALRSVVASLASWPRSKMPRAKLLALAWLARQWVGFREEGGANKGFAVERFQRAVDGKAQGEPWCLAFVMYCLASVDDLFESMAQLSLPGHALYHSEHVMTCWARSPVKARVADPEVGALAIWEHHSHGKATGSGHCGVVVELLGEGRFRAVEGNTSEPGGDQREGDGVWLKERGIDGLPSLRLIGFLRPWLDDR